MSRKYRVLDLFAGIGGFSLGFEMASSNSCEEIFEIVCGVEIDKNACDTLRFNRERQGRDPDVVLQADLTDPATHDLIINKCKGYVDVIIGGPPCQSFSHIGARSAAPKVREKFVDDDRDMLYLEYISLVRQLRPAFLIMENVTGILSKRDQEGQPYIRAVLDSIQEVGYSTYFSAAKTDYLILNAADFGVPQRRERVFIIANRYDIGNPLPKQTHSEGGQVHGTSPWVTLFDAIGDLPPVYPHITMWNVPEDEREKVREANLGRYCGAQAVSYHWNRFWEHYQRIDDKGKAFLDHIMPGSPDTQLTAHVARGQQRSDIELFTKMRPGTTSKHLLVSEDPADKELLGLIRYKMDSFFDKYRKHDWDSVCTTIFAHMQRDGNRFIHPDSNQGRTLTVREAARIQSFPDDYIFTSPGNTRYKYIGNAVPPLLSKAVAEGIAQELQNYEQDKQSQQVGA